MLKYKRVSLKLSGEAMGGHGETVDFEKVEAVARQIQSLQALGVQVGVTLGGGNIWRGRSSGEMDRNRADQMGMLATVINSLALQDCLARLGVPGAGDELGGHAPGGGRVQLPGGPRRLWRPGKW